MEPSNPPENTSNPSQSQSFWATAWRRYRKDRFSMMALYLLAFMFLVAFFSPMIVGVKPLICKYQGHYYFPCMAYYKDSWENPIFIIRDQFGGLYPGNLQRQPKELLKKAEEKLTKTNKEIEKITQDISKLESKLAKNGNLVIEAPLSATEEQTLQSIIKKIETLQQSSKTPEIRTKYKEEFQRLSNQELAQVAKKLERLEDRNLFKYLLSLEKKDIPELVWLRQNLTRQNEIATELLAEMEERRNEPQDTSQNWAIYPLIFADPLDKLKFSEIQAMVQEGYIPSDSWIASLKPVEVNVPPQWDIQILWGTDKYGRDVFARIVHGTRIAMLIGFVSMGIATFIGIIMGGIAGFFGGKVDMLISRFIDLIMAIPTMILILALIAIVDKPSIWDLMIVIGLTSWVTIARLTRGEFLKLKNMDYVMAGHALGFSNTRLMFRHILPNSLAPVIVNVTFGIASAILVESGLSFLGFGVQPPTPSWGNILSDGFKNGLKDYWLIGAPSFAIFVAIFTYNIVGDGLQEALDPRLK